MAAVVCRSGLALPVLVALDGADASPAVGVLAAGGGEADVSAGTVPVVVAAEVVALAVVSLGALLALGVDTDWIGVLTLCSEVEKLVVVG